MSNAIPKQWPFTILLFLILLASLTHSANAAVGVGIGQQLQYKVSRTNLSGNDTDIKDQIPEQTYWINVTVIAIEGNTLTLRTISYNETSTSSNSTMMLDSATGESSPEGAQRIFIPPTRNGGDALHLEYPNNKTFTLNETRLNNYLGRQLLTTLLSYDERATNASYASVTANLTSTWQFWWDQPTGTLVEFNYTIHTSRTADNGDLLELTQNLDLIILSATPMIPELNAPVIILIIVTTTATAVAIASKTKKSSQHSHERIKGQPAFSNRPPHAANTGQ
jgi:hypothetical protein